eukprot:3941943-Rhodomonas_salina.1
MVVHTGSSTDTSRMVLRTCYAASGTDAARMVPPGMYRLPDTEETEKVMRPGEHANQRRKHTLLVQTVRRLCCNAFNLAVRFPSRSWIAVLALSTCAMSRTDIAYGCQALSLRSRFRTPKRKRCAHFKYSRWNPHCFVCGSKLLEGCVSNYVSSSWNHSFVPGCCSP